MARAKKAPRVFMRETKIKKPPAGHRVAAAIEGFAYTTGAKPCTNTSSKRKTCPVQFFYKAGVPSLRFCKKKGGVSYTVEVKSADEAQKVAAKACACWKRTKDFSKCKDVKSRPFGGLGRVKRATQRLRHRLRTRPSSRHRGPRARRFLRFAGLGDVSAR